ncbi:hypothetical protein ACFQ71_28065 [Streptomyces sp. NPDC056534]|uniref:hypothetical protein n=1 Tax=Streptomyces sp. NPDC056534 TaxID=3345857 RepID=UPI00368B1BD4
MVTNPNAFNFGSQERSNNFWANHMAPQKQAERRAKQEAIESEQRRMISAHQEQQRAQQVMSSAGPALIDLIRGYGSQNKPAVTSQVSRDFQERLSGATAEEFQSTLQFLKENGVIHELTSSTQGFMGERTTHLYVIEDL